jgi:hypothetical protein
MLNYELRPQCHRLQIYPKLCCYTPDRSHLDSRRPRALVQATTTRPIDHWLVVPSGHRLWFCLWFQAEERKQYFSCFHLGCIESLHESQGSGYGDRAISVAGLFVFQFCIWLSSKRRSQVPWSVLLASPCATLLLNHATLKAHCHRRIIYPTGCGSFRAQIWSWLLTFQMDCNSCF